MTLVCLRLHLLNTWPATAFPAAEIIWEMETRSGPGVSAVIQRRSEKAHRLPGDLSARMTGKWERRLVMPDGCRVLEDLLAHDPPPDPSDEAGSSVIERSAMPDSPERFHAQIQASIPTGLHGIRRAAGTRSRVKPESRCSPG